MKIPLWKKETYTVHCKRQHGCFVVLEFALHRPGFPSGLIRYQTELVLKTPNIIQCYVSFVNTYGIRFIVVLR